MTNETLVILLAAIPPTSAALVAAFVAAATSRRADRIAIKADTIIKEGQAVAVKADTLIEKTVEIHTLTNGNLSAMTKNFEVAMARIEGLQKMVESQSAAKIVADRVAELQPPVGVADIVNGLTTAIDRAVAAVPAAVNVKDVKP